MQTNDPAVTIWDHGELGDVRSVMNGLGVDFAEGRAGEADELPSHLLISSGSSSVDALQRIKRAAPSHHFLHLVIVERASRSLASVLEREGCDMVVSAPIHPTALRLVVQRALYSGPNKRQVPRVAIAVPVTIKAGLLARNAVLAELSVRGCGLIADRAFSIGDELAIVLPTRLTGAAALKLRGSVVGVKRDVAAEGGGHILGVVFHGQDRTKAVAINKIMQHHAIGPTGQLEHEPGSAMASRAEREPGPTERRGSPRASYENPVLARGSGTVHSLIGRDLSVTGMQVSHHDGLCLGERLRLAIYGRSGEEPVIVTADVVRAVTDSGIGLEFTDLDDATSERLQRIVDGLPKLEGAAPPADTVVSEVLEAS